MLNGVEWARKFVYLSLIEDLKSKELDEKESIVVQWLEEQVELYKAKENDS